MSDLRELNGHPLRVLRAQHNLTLEELAQATGVAAATISRAENGYLVSPAVRKLLCKYFNKTSQELGLLGRGKDLPPDPAPAQPTLPPPEQQLSITPSLVERKETPTVIVARNSPLTLLNEQADVPLEQQLGAWLALEAGQLGQLFDANWTIDSILSSLRIVLQAIQGMPKISRRKLLELEGVAAMSGITLPSSSHVTEEERVQLCEALVKIIVDGWNLFHTATTEQIVSISQAQLYLIQQNHSFLQASVRPHLYSPIYTLLGAGLQFQGHYEGALSAYSKAYITALEASDLRLMIQSLIWQANCQQEIGHPDIAIQTIERALSLTEHQTEEICIGPKAHLLACWADCAMTIGEQTIAREKLDESASFLDQMGPSEEFDRGSWLQLRGKQALIHGDYTKATQQFELALTRIPHNAHLRQANALLSLARAHGYNRERDASLIAAKKSIPLIKSVNTYDLNNQLTSYIQQDLLRLFPNDKKVLTFLEDIQN